MTIIPKEFFDIALVIEMGARKHGADTWLDKDNPSLDRKANHSSMCRHLAEVYGQVTEDEESGLHPALHLACRALMLYARYRRGIDD